MFAHQVIDDLQLWIKSLESNPDSKTKYSLYIESLKTVIAPIKKAQHFYVGDESIQLKGSISQSLKGKPVFNEKERLPYPVCTFSAHYLSDIFNENDSIFEQYKISTGLVERKSSKRLILAKELDENTISLFLCSFIDEKDRWMLQEMAYNVHFDFDTQKRLAPVWLIPLPPGVNSFQKSKEDVGDLSIVDLTLRLLGCKNISTEKIIAPSRLNKKRIGNGKTPIFDYKVLNVFVPGIKGGNIQKDKREPMSHNRIHLCRGHFKEYTSEKPLLGRFVGRYWWQPSIRGKNRNGIIMKDYSIITK